MLGEGDGKNMVVMEGGINVFLLGLEKRVSEIHPRRAEEMASGALASVFKTSEVCNG